MSTAVTHTTAVRDAVADQVIATQLGASSKLVIYSGTPPANAQAALSGNTAIATVTAITYGAVSGGVKTITASTADPSAVGGTAAFYRQLTSGNVVITQGTVGIPASGEGLILTVSTGNLVIAAGATVTLGSGTYTAPP